MIQYQKQGGDAFMALITCIDCGQSVSDHAEICPHCGCPISLSLENQKTSNNNNIFYKCPLCKKPYPNGTLKCNVCGYTTLHTPPKPTTPECPYCHSHDTKKIGSGGRTLSLLTLGLAGSKIGKQWHCKHCGSDF